MARKSFVELSAELITSFPDNTTGAITPEVLRTYMQNFLDAIRPAYGYLYRDVPNTQALTAAPAPVVFEGGLASDVPDYTFDPVTGLITRLEAGSVQISVSAVVEAPNNSTVSLTLFKDGVATPWRASVTSSGANDDLALSFTAFEYSGAAANLQLRASISSPGNVTFNTAEFITETIPVNSY